MVSQTNAMADGGIDFEVRGLEPCDARGPYGDADPYDEHVTVVVDGEEHHVPVTGVRAAAYDYHGNVPDSVDMDRVYLYDGEIHAEAELGDGSVVELHRPSKAWELEYFADPVDIEFHTVWTRSD